MFLLDSCLRRNDDIAQRSQSASRHYSDASPDNKIGTLDEVEKAYIKFILEKLSNNYTQTAKALGIFLSTLKRKIKNYGLK